jgi:hypothetical protein
MNARRILAAVFLLLALGAGYLTWVMWQAGDSGKWLFLVFGLFFLALTAAPLIPEFKRKPPEPPTTRFGPHWFMMLAILVIVLVVLASLISAVRQR